MAPPPPQLELPRFLTPPEPGGPRAVIPLGLGLCFAALALNRWSVGWLVSDGGDLTGALPNVLLVIAQAALFCVGTAVLRRAYRGVGGLSGAALTGLGVAALGIGVLGVAMTLAPFTGSLRLARELELVDAAFDGDRTWAELGELFELLADDLNDGRLDEQTRAWFAPRLTSSDVAPAGEELGCWNGAVFRQRFAPEPSATVAAEELELLRPVFSNADGLEGGRVRLVAATPGEGSSKGRWLVHAELSGRLAGTGGGRLTALLELGWCPASGDGSDSTVGRIDSLGVVSAEVRRAAWPLFEPVQTLPVPEGVRVASLCVADLDGDGREDLHVSSSEGRHLVFLERGEGTQGSGVRYEERGRELGLDLELPGTVAAAADFDDDGRVELLVGLEGVPARYLVQGERGVYRAGVLQLPPDVASIAVADVNADGRLDAYLGVGTAPTPEDLSWVPERPGAPGATGVPKLTGAAKPDVLLLNRAGAGLTPAEGPGAPGLGGRTLQGAFADWDRDGDLDLCVVEDLVGAHFLENDGAGRFAPAQAGFAPALGAGLRSVGFGDHDGDGRLELIAARPVAPVADRLLELLGWSGPELGSLLFWNSGDGFQRVAGDEAAVLAHGPGSGMAPFVDLDGDGRLDLALVGSSGHRRGPDWWRRSRFGEQGLGLRDPRARAAYLERVAGVERQAGSAAGLYLNAERGTPRLEELTDLLALPAAPHAAAWLDADRDGLLDLVTASVGPDGDDLLTLHRNRAGDLNGRAARALAIRLEGGGRGGTGGGGWSARGAQGARIEVHFGDGRVVHRVHRAGQLQGRGGPAATLVGFGSERVAERVVVRWPSGRVQETYDVPAQTELWVYEDPEGSPTGGAVVPRRYQARVLSRELQSGALPPRIGGSD